MSDLDPLAAQRQRIADTERVRRAKLAALEAQGRQAQPAPVPPTRRSERPLDPIEAKRQRMAAALERKQSRQLARPRAQVVILVKPNLRRLRQLRREAAARAQQEKAAPASPTPAPALSAEDEISRRLREARERLQEE